MFALFPEPQFTLGLQNGSWRKSFLLGMLVLLVLISVGAFYARCWLPLVLLCRDKFAPLEENGNYRNPPTASVNCDPLIAVASTIHHSAFLKSRSQETRKFFASFISIPPFPYV